MYTCYTQISRQLISLNWESLSQESQATIGVCGSESSDKPGKPISDKFDYQLHTQSRSRVY